MSDMTSLSNDYSSSADFAKELNRAVLLIKKKHFGPSSVTPEDEAEARRVVCQLLEAILAQLAGETAAAELSVLIPVDVLERLQENHHGKMDWYREDLRLVQKTLQDTAPLEEKHFSLLDEICDAADAIASASFRRLWRR
jgi:hypothetical protein